jgi:multidrug efflux pump
MRRSLGTAVFSGMLGVTLFGIFLTPVFFYVLQWFGRPPAGGAVAPQQPPPEGPPAPRQATPETGIQARPDGRGT